jgi:predicted  nucleic acid-binding Zn-ribbon protein
MVEMKKEFETFTTKYKGMRSRIKVLEAEIKDMKSKVQTDNEVFDQFRV